MNAKTLIISALLLISPLHQALPSSEAGVVLQFPNPGVILKQKCINLINAAVKKSNQIHLTQRDYEESEAETVFDSEKKAVSKIFDTQIDLAKKSGDRDSRLRSYRAKQVFLKGFPHVRISKNGKFSITTSLTENQKNVEFSLINLKDNSLIRSFEIPLESWRISAKDPLTILSKLSPDGNFLVMTLSGAPKIVILETKTGKKVFEESIVEGEEFFGVFHFFSNSGNKLIVERNGLIDIYRLKNLEVTHENQIYLTADARIKEGFEEIAENLPIVTGAIGEVRYVESSNSLVVFMIGEPPIHVFLKGKSGYEIKNFEEARIDYAGFRRENIEESELNSNVVDLNKKQEEQIIDMVEALTNPKYSYQGLVTKDETQAVAVRSQGYGEYYELFLDFFDLRTHRYLRSLRIKDTENSLAMSPNGQLIGVSSNSGKVYIFDLNKSTRDPIIEITAELQDAGLLAFPTNISVVAGSGNYHHLKKWELRSN